jgi:hypothetical protein
MHRDDVLVLFRALKSGIESEFEQLSPLVTTYVCEFLHVLTKGSHHEGALPYRLVVSIFCI